MRLTQGAIAILALSVSAGASAADFRGFVSEGPGVAFFEPCAGKASAGKLFALEDESPDQALYAAVTSVRKIMLERGRPMYVEFRGTVKGKSVTVQRFWRALGRVPTCADAPSLGQERLAAIGDLPAWRLDASNSVARLTLPSGKSVRFPATAFSAPVVTGATRIYDAWSAQDGGTIRVELSEQMCTDGRSETAFGATVTLRYGSTSLEGCATRF